MRHTLKIALLLTIGLATFTSSMAQDYSDPQNMPVEPANTDCHKLPEIFTDANQAQELITSTKFYLEQEFKTTRRRGLMAASYHSCDFKEGFLVVQFDGQPHIYGNVPLETWQKFQGTADIDGFYLKHIKTLAEIQYE